jgi:cytochrome c oxidase assembly protein subunit 15
VTGAATVFFSFPLSIAVLHNAGAALLVLLVTMLNYKAKYQLAVAQPSVQPESMPASHLP